MNFSQPLRRIASNTLWTPQRLVPDPLVTVDGSGCVVAIEHWTDADRLPGVEFYAGMLVPGLVNAHCHLELSYLRGAIEPGCGFAGFAASMGRVRNRADEAERIRAASVADAAMFAAGIQAVGDVSNSETSFAAKRNSRMRYATFAEVYGLRTESTTAVEPLLDYPSTTLTPHSLYSLQDDLFRTVCDRSEGTLSIHFMESPAESQLFERSGDLWDWYARAGFACDFLHYGSPAERLVRSVDPQKRVMLVHACCVTEADAERILNHFEQPVWWCLCPRSNRYISGLRPPVELMRRMGMRICLGTDSLASNRTLSLFAEMMELADIPLPELVGWATAGAEALGMDGLGRIEPGLQPGLSVISGYDPATLHLTPQSRIRRIV